MVDEATRERLVSEVSELSASRFAPRAAAYDRNSAFPAEDFDDLYEHGFLAATVPREYGGLGVGHTAGDPLTLWLITKAIAKGDLSLARCWEGHANAVDQMADLAVPELRERVFRMIVEDGMRLVLWGSEPPRPPGDQPPQEGQQGGEQTRPPQTGAGQARDQTSAPAARPNAPAPGSARRTTAKRVHGGWLLNGVKQFATSAGGATHAIVSATAPDERGEDDPMSGRGSFIVEMTTPGLRIDEAWWHSLGMRSTVSHMVYLEDVFVPQEWEYRRAQSDLQSWQARFIPQFAASFIGAAEAAYDFTLPYLRERGKENDPYVQHHVASMRVSLELAQTYLQHTAGLWASGQVTEAALASNIFRVAAEEQTTNVVSRAIRACGATALLEQHPLGRIQRDLQTYVRHENVDRLTATVGRASLGLNYDPGFSRDLQPGDAARTHASPWRNGR